MKFGYDKSLDVEFENVTYDNSDNKVEFLASVRQYEDKPKKVALFFITKDGNMSNHMPLKRFRLEDLENIICLLQKLKEKVKENEE